MPWIRKLLRGKKIWARCDMTGKLIANPDKRVDIVYSRKGQVYQALIANISAAEECTLLHDEEVAPTPNRSNDSPEKSVQGTLKSQATESAFSPHELDTHRVYVYSDGACMGNPGPTGIGVVIIDPLENSRQELYQYTGHGTNNIAELRAIELGLSHAPKHRPVTVCTDSAYALGVLFFGWKTQANQALVGEIKRLIAEFTDLRPLKVRGHAGIAENERCDELAQLAIRDAHGHRGHGI